jgi:hypothetical protein
MALTAGTTAVFCSEKSTGNRMRFQVIMLRPLSTALKLEQTAHFAVTAGGKS